MKLSSLPFKYGLSVLLTVPVLLFSIHTEIFSIMPVWLEGTVLVILASLQLIVSNLLDANKLQRAFQELQERFKKISLDSAEKERELNELRKVISSFLEHSEIYRNRVRDFLKLNEDYVCIIKSAEGFGEVWEKLSNDQKRPLPFTSVLMNLPGSIRPIENIGLFLIPISNLHGITKMPLRSYINKNIIPKVDKERKKFIKTLPKELAAKADDFSYKYLAFYLRKDAIAHETRNRKFNREFNAFIVNEQVGETFNKMRTELTNVIKGKDVLRLVNWSSFAKLNDEREDFIEKNKTTINNALEKNHIIEIRDLAVIDPNKLSAIIWSSLKKSQKEETTEKKIQNLCESVVEGAQNTINILQKNGVNI